MKRQHYPTPSPYESRHCVVYAIELDPSVIEDSAFLRKNPKWDPSKPAYYVGMTSLSPEERYQQHRSGSTNVSRIAHEYGLALRMDIVPDQAPSRRTWAMKRETRLAKDLRSRGFGAWMG